jgi:CheY-like chemotaxis protein
VEPSEFRVLVEDALAHLYEPTYLQTHPLTWSLATTPAGEVRGLALQRLLLTTIQELKPRAEVPYESLAWRKYRYLYLRYIETISPTEIAEDLAVSLRQSSRYWHESLEALTSILWDKCQVRSSSGTLETSPEEPLLEQEAARMDTGAGAGYARLAEVLHGALETIEPLVQTRGNRLAAEVPESLPLVAVNRTVLRLAIVGLLSLAIESAARDTREGVVSLVIAAKRGAVEVTLSIGRRGAVFGVAKEGPSPDEVGRDSRWRIARRLLEPHQATLRVCATTAGGVSMLMALPTVQPSAVLVVEDNPDAIDLFRRYLTGTPYRVLAARTGQEAISMADAEQPSVITLDVMMPGQDGWEILHILKSRPSTRETPVIVCSVLPEHELALLLGAAAVLAKPITRQQFLTALSAVRKPGHLREPVGS